MIILQYHEIFFRLSEPRHPGMAPGAVSLRKSHDIVILSFCNIVNGQANFGSRISISKFNSCIHFMISYQRRHQFFSKMFCLMICDYSKSSIIGMIRYRKNVLVIEMLMMKTYTFKTLLIVMKL